VKQLKAQLEQAARTAAAARSDARLPPQHTAVGAAVGAAPPGTAAAAAARPGTAAPAAARPGTAAVMGRPGTAAALSHDELRQEWLTLRGELGVARSQLASSRQDKVVCVCVWCLCV